MSTSKKYKSIYISVLVVIFLTISAFGCKKSVTGKPIDPGTGMDTVIAKSILFVGNSLTYNNDLPALVQQIGKEKGIVIKTKTLAYPSYALEDHWNDGNLQILIASKKYDFTVIQQGPSSQADGRVSLFDYGARIKAVCDLNNSKLAFFMVWPAFSNFHTFDGVIKNYTDAAVATNSILCPGGKTWKEYFAASGDYSYYGPDMFHP